MGRAPRRIPIQAAIIPTVDLGMLERQIEGLVFPDDVPLGMALQVVRTPAGPRISLASPNGQTNGPYYTRGVVRPTTTEGAGNTGAQSFNGFRGVGIIVEVTALTGAPTSVDYQIQGTLDGGTTWYTGIKASATAASQLIALNTTPGNTGLTAGGDIKATAAGFLLNQDVFRVIWAFTGGTAPTVTHKMWGFWQ